MYAWFYPTGDLQHAFILVISSHNKYVYKSFPAALWRLAVLIVLSALPCLAGKLLYTYLVFVAHRVLELRYPY